MFHRRHRRGDARILSAVVGASHVPVALAQTASGEGVSADLPTTWLAVLILALLAVLGGAWLAARAPRQWRLQTRGRAAARTVADDDGEPPEATPPPEEVTRLRHVTRALGREIKKSAHSLKRLERLLRLTVAVNRALAGSINEADLLDRFCRTLVLVGGYRFVWLGLETAGALHRVSKFSSTGFEDLDAFLLWSLSAREGHNESSLQSILRTADWNLSRRARAPAFDKYGEYAGGHLFSATALPLRINEQAVGVVVICSDAEGAFDGKERQALAQIGTDLALRLATLQERAIETIDRVH